MYQYISISFSPVFFVFFFFLFFFKRQPLEFVFLADETFSKGLPLKEGICSNRSKFLPLRVDPMEEGGQNENC